MIGQILDSADPSNLLSNIPVFLHIGGRVVAATNTNEFGEFQLECDWLGNLLLSATLADGREVVAALGELIVSQDNDRSSANFSQADAASVTEEERKKKKA